MSILNSFFKYIFKTISFVDTLYILCLESSSCLIEREDRAGIELWDFHIFHFNLEEFKVG